jgi:hypothetical protein
MAGKVLFQWLSCLHAGVRPLTARFHAFFPAFQYVSTESVWFDTTSDFLSFIVKDVLFKMNEALQDLRSK